MADLADILNGMYLSQFRDPRTGEIDLAEVERFEREEDEREEDERDG